MINEFVFFGCSHSIMDWEKYWKTPIKISCFAESGSSNELILKKLKTYLNDNWENIENKILVIQFTYFHRKHIFFDLTQKEHKLNGGNAIIFNPEFTTEQRKILNNYYTDWLKYFYNGQYEFTQLVNELQFLKKVFELKKIKFVWYLWDDILYDEILFDKKDSNKINFIKDICNELNFIKFDEELTANKYVEKNKLRNCDISNTSDRHISELHKQKFIEIIKNKTKHLEIL